MTSTINSIEDAKAFAAELTRFLFHLDEGIKQLALKNVELTTENEQLRHRITAPEKKELPSGS
jgi:regulator of replication initiation timing